MKVHVQAEANLPSQHQLQEKYRFTSSELSDYHYRDRDGRFLTMKNKTLEKIRYYH